MREASASAADAVSADMQRREESCKRQLCGGKVVRLGNRWVWNGMPVRKIAKQKLQCHSEEGAAMMRLRRMVGAARWASQVELDICCANIQSKDDEGCEGEN